MTEPVPGDREIPLFPLGNVLFARRAAGVADFRAALPRSRGPMHEDADRFRRGADP